MDTISDNTTGGRPPRQRICEGCRRLVEVADENERLRDALRLVLEYEDGTAPSPDIWERAINATRAALADEQLTGEPQCK
jgi:hypothetical protein